MKQSLSFSQTTYKQVALVASRNCGVRLENSVQRKILIRYLLLQTRKSGTHQNNRSHCMLSKRCIWIRFLHVCVQVIQSFSSPKEKYGFTLLSLKSSYAYWNSVDLWPGLTLFRGWPTCITDRKILPDVIFNATERCARGKPHSLL